MKPYICGSEPSVHIPSGGCECNYTIERVEDENLEAKYVLMNNGEAVDVPIEIPKDMYVVDVTEEEYDGVSGPPFTGATAGDHYLDIEMSDGNHFIVGLPTTKLTAGNNVYLNTTTSGMQTLYEVNASTGGQGGSYTPGANIQINGNVISATDTTYTAGTNVSISNSNVISATDTTAEVQRGSGYTGDLVTSSKGVGITIESSVSGDVTTYGISAPWLVVHKQLQYTISANGYKAINWTFLDTNGYTKVGIVQCTTGTTNAYFATIGVNQSVIKSSVAGTFTAEAYCLYLKS